MLKIKWIYHIQGIRNFESEHTPVSTFIGSTTINNQKIFKRVMGYECIRIIHYDSSFLLLLQSLIIKRRLILHTVV